MKRIFKTTSQLNVGIFNPGQLALIAASFVPLYAVAAKERQRVQLRRCRVIGRIGMTEVRTEREMILAVSYNSLCSS